MKNTPILRSLIMAGTILAGSVALVLAKRAGLIDGDVTTRGVMVLIGLVMLVIANDIPKSTAPKTARGQALQRQTGRAMVVAYLVWLAVWLFAPMGMTTGLSILPVLGAAAFVAFVCFRNRRTVV